MSAPEPVTVSFAAQHSVELYSVIGVLVAMIGALFLIIHNSVNGTIAKLEVENGSLWRELRKTQNTLSQLIGSHNSLVKASDIHIGGNEDDEDSNK